jgi:hypothetical protein
MQVKFEATFEDLVDVSLRSITHSKRYASAKRNGWILTSLFVGLAVFVIIPSAFGERLIWGVIASCLVALLYPYLSQRSLERRVRNYCQDELGSDDSFPVEIGLGPEGITYKQLKMQVTHEWSSVHDIQVTSDRIDFILQNGGVITVRARAFETPEQREEFIDMASGYVDLPNRRRTE